MSSVQSLGAFEPVPEGGAAQAARVLRAAADLLEQGETLLSALSPEQYAMPVPAVFNASIGGHYRHCLDHFASLITGLNASLVDYDHRCRDPRLEREPGFARAVTRQLRQQLEQWAPAMLSRAVAARCEVSYEPGHSPVTQSTVGRELVYAIAHGIHHYALISVMARLQNVKLPEAFGVAPSTVAHQRSSADA